MDGFIITLSRARIVHFGHFYPLLLFLVRFPFLQIPILPFYSPPLCVLVPMDFIRVFTEACTLY